MKKREQEKKDNVIFFPDLDKRLLQKGLDAIQEKRFKEAVSFLEEAKERNPVHSDINIGLILSYYELGLLDQAKQIAKEMLKEDQGDYIQVLDLYIMILVQLHEYEEIVTTIEVLLEEHQIPANKIEHFSKMLIFSRKMADSSSPVDKDDYSEEEPLDAHTNLMELENPQEQMLLIAKMSTQNIRAYIEEVELYLRDEEKNPFLKTMLINILQEQEYEKEVVIQKFNRTIVIKPTALKDMKEQEQYQKITSILIDYVESNDPILFENIKMLIDRQIFLLYPFTLDDYSEETWAAAYHSVVNQYFGQEEGEEILVLYGVKEDDLEQAKTFINQLEQISYPNI
ncbi:tetratricopeptide repeat protein [Cytobacillus oceanisediminis]|uniref:Tetratricopeptide repeat protein n=1 Tax=Niallia alba TaxID=2729105 RepID=A0A7Y0KBR2_9BACI|nr:MULTISPECIES: tetratricopeptide repeat protein [Bacillaceae]MBQ6448982.1 tetratricopeptide repeat protein [Bacillus sp. (in: firmicutes)]MBZ9533603.1 tetratricopeptide repeat protein [Cytobacillus oceanisediminis]MDU1844192.1 tetratricopeptide repeat protein [Niallia nealsonii]NMO78699.1 tetratricopeptide repeat protein [Niallia alba]